MKRHAVRMLRLVAGSILLIVGVIGGFIPVLQGWIFILLGLSIIAPESERAQRLLAWAKARAGASRPAQSPSAEGSRGPIGSAGEGRNS